MRIYAIRLLKAAQPCLRGGRNVVLGQQVTRVIGLNLNATKINHLEVS